MCHGVALTIVEQQCAETTQLILQTHVNSAVLESRDKLAKSRRSFSMLFSNLNDLQM